MYKITIEKDGNEITRKYGANALDDEDNIVEIILSMKKAVDSYEERMIDQEDSAKDNFFNR